MGRHTKVSGVFGGHLNFGDPQRYWDFRSIGRGNINFEEIIRALNHMEYDGPLSIEWEDSGMDREHGARESCAASKAMTLNPLQSHLMLPLKNKQLKYCFGGSLCPPTLSEVIYEKR